MGMRPNRDKYREEFVITAIGAAVIGLALGPKGLIGAVVGIAWAFYISDSDSTKNF